MPAGPRVPYTHAGDSGAQSETARPYEVEAVSGLSVFNHIMGDGRQWFEHGLYSSIRLTHRLTAAVCGLVSAEVGNRNLLLRAGVGDAVRTDSGHRTRRRSQTSSAMPISPIRNHIETMNRMPSIKSESALRSNPSKNLMRVTLNYALPFRLLHISN